MEVVDLFLIGFLGACMALVMVDNPRQGWSITLVCSLTCCAKHSIVKLVLASAM